MDENVLLLTSSWLTKSTSGSILSWLMWLKSITELLSPLNDPNTSVQMFEWRRLYQPTKCYGFLVVSLKLMIMRSLCIGDLLIIALRLTIFAFTATFFSFVSRILSLPVRAYSHYLQRLILLLPCAWAFQCLLDNPQILTGCKNFLTDFIFSASLSFSMS